jgi:hypothetical protein
MALISFVPKNEIADYLTICWGVSNANNLAENALGAYNVTVANGSFIVSQTEADGIPVVMTLDIIDDLLSLLFALLPRVTGYCIFAAIFGGCFPFMIPKFATVTDGACRHFIHCKLSFAILPLEELEKDPFSFYRYRLHIRYFGLQCRALRCAICLNSCEHTKCDLPTIPIAEQLLRFHASIDTSMENIRRANTGDPGHLPRFLAFHYSCVYMGIRCVLGQSHSPPIKIQAADVAGRQIYRAWVIWIYHRNYTAVPALVYLASISE